MTHEPECPVAGVEPTAYDYEERAYYDCICDLLLKAYRRGHNDHARAQQHWADTHGAYTQHGEGENP